MGVDMATHKSTTEGGLSANEGKIHNFSVYKISTVGGNITKTRRRILQIDFQSRNICTVNNGKRNNGYPFGKIAKIESNVSHRGYLPLFVRQIHGALLLSSCRYRSSSAR